MAAGSPIGLLLTLTQADGGGDGEVCGTPIGMLLTLTHCIGEPEPEPEPEPEAEVTETQGDPGGYARRRAEAYAIAQRALEDRRAKRTEAPVVVPQVVVEQPKPEAKPEVKLTPASSLGPILVGKAVMGLQLPSLTEQVRQLEADDEEAIIAILLALKGS
jgi:hypothetical protein